MMAFSPIGTGKRYPARTTCHIPRQYRIDPFFFSPHTNRSSVSPGYPNDCRYRPFNVLGLGQSYIEFPKLPLHEGVDLTTFIHLTHF